MMSKKKIHGLVKIFFYKNKGTCKHVPDLNKTMCNYNKYQFGYQ